MKINKIKSIALICSIIFISSFIVSCINIKNAQKDLNRKLSNEQWIEDLDYLTNELPKRHKNLFFNITQDNFEQQIEGLKKEVPNLNDEQIAVGICKIIASVGDAHTSGVSVFTKVFPMQFYWFQKNIYVINTRKNYKDVLYNEVVSINGKSIYEVIEEITKIISHENMQWVKSILPKLISLPELLYGLNLIENTESTTFTFKDSEGNLVNIDIKSQSIKESTEWIMKENNNEDIPLYRKKSDENYWYEYLQDSKTLYFKYNLCYGMKDKPIKKFMSELRCAIYKNETDKLVIDLRNNIGGDEKYLRNFIDEIYLSKINQADKLFVIIGRDTMSSGLKGAVHAKKYSNATLIGEGTGGKPNHYGERKDFSLKNSHLKVSYSTRYFKDIDEDIDSLLPDVNVETTIKDYIENRDPVLERILNNK